MRFEIVASRGSFESLQTANRNSRHLRSLEDLPKRWPSECTKILGSAFGRTDFSRIFIFEPPDFFADFLAGFFLLSFVGKSAQKNPPGKSPAKSSKIYTTKIPDTFLQRGRAKKSRDCLRLRRRFLPLPPQNRAIFKAPRCAISSAKKIASDRRFSLRLKETNFIPTVEFTAIPESAAKIASERRCAILVHSVGHLQNAHSGPIRFQQIKDHPHPQ